MKPMVVRRALIGCAYPFCYDVVVGNRIVGSRMHHPTDEEIKEIVQLATKPISPIPEFDKTTNTHRRGRPSNAERAARDNQQEQE